MKKLLFILLFLCGTLTSWAQVSIQGRITQKGESSAVADVVVTATDKKGARVYGYGFSDDQGKYNLTFKMTGDTVYVAYKLMGYKTVQRTFRNVSQTVDIQLEPDVIKLKEVIVRQPKIEAYGDTISYNVNAIKQEGDDHIIDVIKRLPGIEVSAAGTIRYMGKNISKFYIEGMDMLDGRYSIATNSIPTDMVQNVQVLENHQDKRVLKGKVSTDRAAMNIKLKKDVKLKPVGKATLGAGASTDELKGMADIVGLMVSDKGQRMLTLKANNTGQLLQNETMDLSESLSSITAELEGTPSSLLTPTLGTAPQAVEDYTHFNTSFLGTYNRLLKLGDVDQLKFNLFYRDEKDNTQHESNTIYGVNEDNQLVVSRIHDLTQHGKQGNAQIDFTRNAENRYLDEKLTLDGFWNTSRTDLSGTDVFHEKFHTPYAKVENKVDYTWSAGKTNYTYKSLIGYQRQPEDAVFTEADGAYLNQDRNRERFYITNELSQPLGWGYHLLTLNYGATMELDKQESELKGSMNRYEEMAGRYDWHGNRYELSFTPSYSFSNMDSKGFSFSASVPLSGIWFKYSGHIPAKEKFSYISLKPSVSFSWRPVRRLLLSLRGIYSRAPQNWERYSSAFYLTNSTNLQQGVQDLNVNERKQGTFSVDYRNPYLELFSRLSLIYIHQKSNLLSGYDFLGTTLVHVYFPKDNTREQFMGTLNVNKLFNFWRSNVNLTLGYNKYGIDYYQAGKVGHRSVEGGNVMLHWDMKPLAWLGVSLNGMSAFSHIRTRNTIWLHRLQGTFSFNISKKFVVMTDAELSMNQLEASHYKRFTLLNMTARYKAGKNLNLDLDCYNLTNCQQYVLRSLDGVNQYDDIYLLRPRQILLKVSFSY